MYIYQDAFIKIEITISITLQENLNEQMFPLKAFHFDKTYSALDFLQTVLSVPSARSPEIENPKHRVLAIT